MVAVGGLAGWFAVGEATWGALAFFFLLYGWETGRNLTNDLADVVHDRMVGITTLASVHGPKAASKVILGDAVAMVAISLAQPVAWVVRGLVAAVALLTMTLPSLVLYRDPDEPSAQRYFNRLTFFPPLAAACAIIVAVVTYFADSRRLAVAARPDVRGQPLRAHRLHSPRILRTRRDPCHREPSATVATSVGGSLSAPSCQGCASSYKESRAPRMRGPAAKPRGDDRAGHCLRLTG